MSQRSNVTPGLAITHQMQNYNNMREAISIYFGGTKINAVDMLRKQTIQSGELKIIFILKRNGPHTVSRLAKSTDIRPLKDLLESIIKKTISIYIQKHVFFMYSGRINPPMNKAMDGDDQIEITFIE